MVVPLLSLGGKGVISVVANILPEETHNMCQEFFDGNIENARRQQLAMLDLINKLFIEVNPVPVKTAMRLLGYNVGNLRMPLCDMEEVNLEKLKDAMRYYGMEI